jgi:hypothetical protein
MSATKGTSNLKAFNKATKYVVTRSLDQLGWDLAAHRR